MFVYPTHLGIYGGGLVYAGAGLVSELIQLLAVLDDLAYQNFDFRRVTVVIDLLGSILEAHAISAPALQHGGGDRLARIRLTALNLIFPYFHRCTELGRKCGRFCFFCALKFHGPHLPYLGRTNTKNTRNSCCRRGTQNLYNVAGNQAHEACLNITVFNEGKLGLLGDGIAIHFGAGLGVG